MKKELIFVYNADSGIFAAATDFVKKLTNPKEYDCNLCLVTYGAIKMQNPWKEYLDTIPYKKTFLHRNELRERYPDLLVDLPVILENTGATEPKVFLSAAEINSAKNIQDLIVKLTEKMT